MYQEQLHCINLLLHVPFVAGLFARPPEFVDEFTERIPVELRNAPTGGMTQYEQATVARCQDFQRLLAPVMTAQWTIVHFPDTVQLTTNDRGFATTHVPAGALVGGDDWGINVTS